jgi:hypothetical protein
MLGFIRTVMFVRLPFPTKQLNEHRVGVVPMRIQLHRAATGYVGHSWRDHAQYRSCVECLDVRMSFQQGINHTNGFLRERRTRHVSDYSPDSETSDSSGQQLPLERDEFVEISRTLPPP